MLTTKTQIGFDQFFLGQVGAGLAVDNRPDAPLDFLRRHLQIFFDMAHVPPHVADLFGHMQDHVMAHAERRDQLGPILFLRFGGRDHFENLAARFAEPVLVVFDPPLHRLHALHGPLETVGDGFGLFAIEL